MKKAFTLFELLLVLAIVGFFIGLVIPLATGMNKRAKHIRWRTFITAMNHDPYTVLNFDFENREFKTDYKGARVSALFNGAIGSESPNFFAREYHGVLKNGLEWKKGGRWGVNHTLQFDGRDDYVEVPGTLALDFNPKKDDFTIETWVSLDTLDCSAQTFFSKSEWMTSAQYDAYYTKNRIEVDVGASNAAWDSLNIEAGKWINIVLTNESGKYKLYLNGTMAGYRTFENTMALSGSKTSNKFILGAAGLTNGETGYYLHGRMDEIILFRRALGPSEIKNIYEIGNPY